MYIVYSQSSLIPPHSVPLGKCLTIHISQCFETVKVPLYVLALLSYLDTPSAHVMSHTQVTYLARYLYRLEDRVSQLALVVKLQNIAQMHTSCNASSIFKGLCFAHIDSHSPKFQSLVLSNKYLYRKFNLKTNIKFPNN